MKTIKLALILSALIVPACSESKDTGPKEPPKPFVTKQVAENFYSIEFLNPERDKVNPTEYNYSEVLRSWIQEHPQKTIITILATPAYMKGIRELFIRTKDNVEAKPQKVIQITLPTELPDEYPIATLIFDQGRAGGIIGVSQ